MFILPGRPIQGPTPLFQGKRGSYVWFLLRNAFLPDHRHHHLVIVQHSAQL